MVLFMLYFYSLDGTSPSQEDIFIPLGDLISVIFFMLYFSYLYLFGDGTTLL